MVPVDVDEDTLRPVLEAFTEFGRREVPASCWAAYTL